MATETLNIVLLVLGVATGILSIGGVVVAVTRGLSKMEDRVNAHGNDISSLRDAGEVLDRRVDEHDVEIATIKAKIVTTH